ncbi:hypothetical protein [Streptomyces sp. NPDC017260]|uniref:hypothetical protein n=1 Tax=unclassified Streptomyces TaxID=2593676 RepID=UPI00378965D1
MSTPLPEITADRIGLETGYYRLPCGCRIYVYFPGGTIHVHGSTTTQCEELRRLWAEYWQSCRAGHNWASLNLYLACLLHVGAWQGRVASITADRDRYPRPASSFDYLQPEKEITGAHA